MENQETSLNAFLHDPITPLWRALASAKALLLLLVILGVVLLLSIMVPQLPAEARGDDLAYNRWLTELRDQHGDTVDLWRDAGLLDIRASVGLRLLLAALALCIALRTIDLALRLRDWQRGDLGGPLAERTLDGAWDAMSAKLRPWLAARGYRMRLDEQDDRAQLTAWRFPWRTALQLLAHIGALCILLGLALNYRAGWQEAPWPLGVGQKLPIGHDTALSLEGQEISTRASSDGLPEALSSQLRLWRGDTLARQVRVRPGRPAYYRGILISQTGVGPAVAFTAQDAAGRALEVQALSQAPGQGDDVRFEGNGSERYLYVPEAKLTLRLTYYDDLTASSDIVPVIHVEAYRSGQATAIYDAFLSPDGAWSIGGIAYRMRSAPYAVLHLSFVPGLWPIVVGLLFALGGALALLLPAAQDRGVMIAGSAEQVVLSTTPSAGWGRAMSSNHPWEAEIAGLLGE